MKNMMLALGLIVLAVPAANAQTVRTANPPVILAQSTDAGFRISQLEEQIRQLNGQIEELNFQLLQMEERIRRMQEDNDFRLRELEEKSGLGSGPSVAGTTEGNDSLGKAEPSGQNNSAASPDGTVANNTPRRTIDGVEIYEGPSGQDTNIAESLGTLRFDENGNLVDSTIAQPLDLSGGNSESTGGEVAALPRGPDEMFESAYRHVQVGRYEEAEKAWLEFASLYPDHPRLPEARFWLGESYLGQRRYERAAKTYLDAHKNWPNSKLAPQTLLKLGVSVAGLNQRELACATFAEVIEKYPDASRAVRRNVLREQRNAGCLTN